MSSGAASGSSAAAGRRAVPRASSAWRAVGIVLRGRARRASGGGVRCATSQSESASAPVSGVRSRGATSMSPARRAPRRRGSARTSAACGALGVAIEVDAQERGIAGGRGELPEQGLGRGARRSPGAKANCAGERGVLPGHLVAAGGGEHVLAHRDHHRGDVLAGRVEVAEQRLGEEAVPPDAVVGDVVGLGREGEEEARRRRRPGRARRVPGGRATGPRRSGLLRQASRKTRWMPAAALELAR